MAPSQAVENFTGVRAMDDSDTYLMILEEGEAKGFRRITLALGEDCFGPPDESVKTSLNDITDLGRLERIALRTHEASSWQDLLDTP
jgi:hypothetical protein